MRRRGVHHGWAIDRGTHDVGSRELSNVSQLRSAWRQARPLVLRGVGSQGVHEHARAIESTLAVFERLRAGAEFQDELWQRKHVRLEFEPGGASVDLGDPREIEKVFAHARGRAPHARPLARDLYAKLSWIAHDARDRSLRIRFSFGAEQLMDWQKEVKRAPHADRFCEAVFPECAILSDNPVLAGFAQEMLGCRVRLSERIVYNNAPGGGAVLHHDAEPNQLGVLYGQFAGRTAWLALPKRRLAHQLLEAGRATNARAALRLLDGDYDAPLTRLLHNSPRFTRRLVEVDAFLVLEAGDALFLPSPAWDDCCWHSVFALGRRASLAHSYGIFAQAGPARVRAKASSARPSQGRERDG